jgi:hypothetical protein
MNRGLKAMPSKVRGVSLQTIHASTNNGLKNRII